MFFSKKDEKIPTQQTEAILVPPSNGRTERIFQGNGFNINQPSDWQDKTIYTLVGPESDGIQHNIIVMIDENVPFDSVSQYADTQIIALESELKGCAILKREDIQLSNGYPAYKILLRWFPTDIFRVYQEQVYVLVDKTVYKITTTFTKITRKTLGPEIDRIVMSFQPNKL
jgi:hypothetical protein